MASDKNRILAVMGWLSAFILIWGAGIFAWEYNKIKKVLDMDALPPEIMMVYYLGMAALAMAVAALILIIYKR